MIIRLRCILESVIMYIIRQHIQLTVDYYRKTLRKVIELTKKNDYTVIYYCEDSDLEQVESNIKELKEDSLK